ncbi:CLOCK-interacting pacemaker isoform X1 [Lethenteron reissneri]|uniref:CLOCK-interacting pacemaker isoform X1 n=1 Tax=Lethenteron reissneri TaxID=7753 RepID=UPI002AB661A2|nr:CLOCK-interacting pacemaker isoform X1 [Lethenteron reissneri]XP_061424332.1 CLOCK-interacting pacemaker isoform X1 [Lethenteron reissneri]
MEAVRKEGTPRSTLPKATAPTSSASEQDSGFSDTSSEHHSLVEGRDGGGVRRQGLGSGDGACGGVGAKPQAVAQSTSTFAQPGLHSFYILKNVFINQPLCMTSDPQVMHAQLKAWSGDHSQILLVPGPPLATPHEQQPLPPSPSSQPKPCAYQPQAKTSGYLPIFNSYQRIAPRPGKAEGAAPESVVPPSPLSPLLPSGSPPPPPPQSRVDGGPWSGKRPQFANGEGARAFVASVAGAASPMPPQQQQQRSKKKGSVVTMRDTQLTPRSKHQHAAQQEQHQRHRQKHSRSRHRHRHMKKVSHRDRTPLSQQFTTLVSLLNSAGPSIPIAPLAEPQGAALGTAGAAGVAGAPEEVAVAVAATAVSAATPPPSAAFPPRSPAVSPPCSPAPCKLVADAPLLPAAMVPLIAPCVPVPVLCEDELQTMDFLDEVLPLGPEGMGAAAAAGGHAHGGEEQSRGRNGSGDADQGGGGGSSDGFSAGGHEQRFHNTVSILSRSGLLDITMRTKDLLQRNGQAQRELEHLRQLARLFCRAARSPEPSAWDSLQEAMGALGGSAEPAAASASSSLSSSSSSSLSSIAEIGGPGSQDTGLVGCDDGGGGGGNVGEACLPWAALTDASCQGSIGVVTSWAA